MITFNKKVLIIGYGSVSRCTIPILLKLVNVPSENITVIDFEDKSAELKKYAPAGIKFFRQKVTPENMNKVLSQHLEKGGLLIDLAWNIDCCEIVTWCHEHEVLYVNTSVEVWDSFAERFTASPYGKSLYSRQMKLRELTKSWKDATTFVLDHGANPGLISHFAKQGAIDIAHKLIKDNKAKNPAKLEKLIDARDFAGLGHELGIKVIHCSERDTQITNKPKEVDEFVGTWSIEGLREEGTAPAEMGWGTHEKTLPKLA
ncbi:MAG: saccharopine dehydrogenase NADP-binding domain-containing protein, partial [Candidatus Omnitrophica bacterium]|nr:saccharopine dehydrogenase NADP-binding domain-containing protein [Candidatus Omnitrophota bacterium]